MTADQARTRTGKAGASKARSGGKAAKAKPAANPLLAAWRTPFAVPPFAEIRPEHFPMALEKAFRDHRAEVRAIAASAAKPTVQNTILALEKSGTLLDRIAHVFSNLEAADSNEELRAIAREMSPRFAAHESAILLDARLFKRIDDLYERRDRLKLDDEQLRLLERTHLSFVRAGAKLKPAAKKRVAAINARLASLVTVFMQNVLKDEQSWTLTLASENDLAGLPEGLRAAAAREADERGLAGKHVITLARSSVEGFLTFSARRELREQAFNAWIGRGAGGGETDNRAVLAEIVALRKEYARLLGFDTFASFALSDTMAKTPEAVDRLLSEVWGHARRRAAEERDALAAAARGTGSNAPIEAWDWRYFAEKCASRASISTKPRSAPTCSSTT